MAKIITAYVHDLLQQVDKGEISFSRMVELINEKANEPAKVSEPFPSDEDCKGERDQKERYHFENMSIQYGDSVPTKFAAMCCGNSFYDAIVWLNGQIPKSKTSDEFVENM